MKSIPKLLDGMAGIAFGVAASHFWPFKMFEYKVWFAFGISFLLLEAICETNK